MNNNTQEENKSINEGTETGNLTCMTCGNRFYGEEPKLCCSGKDCGCMGQPTEPIVCSKECYEALMNKYKPTPSPAGEKETAALSAEELPENILYQAILETAPQGAILKREKFDNWKKENPNLLAAAIKAMEIWSKRCAVAAQSKQPQYNDIQGENDLRIDLLRAYGESWQPKDEVDYDAEWHAHHYSGMDYEPKFNAEKFGLLAKEILFEVDNSKPVQLINKKYNDIQDK
jgi:hypothetical protein